MSWNVRSEAGWALTVAALVLAGCAPAENAGPTIGAPIPEYAAADLAGDTVALSDLRGEVVLVNLWATWCGPCRSEMPFLESLYEEHEDEGFRIVGISMDTADAADDVAMFVDEIDITYTILHDPKMRGMELYRVLGLPASFLIDRDGVLRWMRYGPFSEQDPEFKRAFEDVLQ